MKNYLFLAAWIGMVAPSAMAASYAEVNQAMYSSRMAKINARGVGNEQGGSSFYLEKSPISDVYNGLGELVRKLDIVQNGCPTEDDACREMEVAEVSDLVKFIDESAEQAYKSVGQRTVQDFTYHWGLAKKALSQSAD